MDRPSLHDDDIVTWADEQAASLRALGARADLSHAIDWENVAEEIDSVARPPIHAVESLLAQALAHLLKRASAPTVRSSLDWRQEIVTFRSAALTRYEPSMRRRIRWDRVWKLAITMANSALLADGGELLPDLPKSCPIAPDQMLSDSFDVDEALLILSTAPKPS